MCGQCWLWRHLGTDQVGQGHQSRAELSGAEQSTAEQAEEGAYILNRRAGRIVLDYVRKRTDSDTFLG